MRNPHRYASRVSFHLLLFYLEKWLELLRYDRAVISGKQPWLEEWKWTGFVLHALNTVATKEPAAKPVMEMLKASIKERKQEVRETRLFIANPIREMLAELQVNADFVTLHMHFLRPLFDAEGKLSSVSRTDADDLPRRLQQSNSAISLLEQLIVEVKSFWEKTVFEDREAFKLTIDIDNHCLRLWGRDYPIADEHFLVINALFGATTTLTTADLQRITKRDEPIKDLKAVIKKHPDIAPFVHFPGKRNKGLGYRISKS